MGYSIERLQFIGGKKKTEAVVSEILAMESIRAGFIHDYWLNLITFKLLISLMEIKVIGI